MVRVRVGVVLLKGDEILLIRQQKGDRTYWLLPGGGIDLGERIQETACREVKEETGLDMEMGPLLFVSESIAPDLSKHLINITFLGKITGGELRLGREGILRELRFVKVEDLLHMDLHPPLAEFLLQAYREKFSSGAKFLGPLWR